MNDILIIGGGIGGLTLALELHQRNIPCRVFESAPEINAIGVGINLLPHATRVLSDLGLQEALAKVGVETAEAAFFNRFGQLIYREPLGRRAGYRWPQFSIHRGDLQAILLDAVKARLGEDRLQLGFHCTGFTQDDASVVLEFRDKPPLKGAALIGCDGIHSVIRKLVHYPIRNNIDAQGRQLVNWLWEIETPNYKRWDWNRPAKLDDFIGELEDWKFDWLDVPAFFRAADVVLEYPMVDKDPLPAWSFGRVTLLGDAAHPMYPRGSNGAGQAILDARSLAQELDDDSDIARALKSYEDERLMPTANVVLENRRNPPDAILREIYERTGDRPYERIENVISPKEVKAISDRYKGIAGYAKSSLPQ